MLFKSFLFCLITLSGTIPKNCISTTEPYLDDTSTVSTTRGGKVPKDDTSTVSTTRGGKVPKGVFPWVVSIQVTNFQQGWHICGGILISTEWALTAAHCLGSEKPEWLWVVTGEYDMNVEEGTEQRLWVDSFVQHPEYVYWKKPYTNDVALIHLSTPAVLGKFTKIAPLPNSSATTFISGFVLCYEIGWGAAADSKPGTKYVEYAPVRLLDPSVCLSAYGSFSDGDTCVQQEKDEDVGVCAVDDGSPLHCKEQETKKFVVSSVISWRAGCTDQSKPGIYMNIAYYLDWISSIILKEKLP